MRWNTASDFICLGLTVQIGPKSGLQLAGPPVSSGALARGLLLKSQAARARQALRVRLQQKLPDPGWPGRFQPLARTRALCEQKNKIKGPLRGRLVQKPKVTSQCSAMLSLRLALQRRWQPEFQSLWRALLRGGDHDDSDRGRDIPAFTGSLTRQPVCAFVQKDMRGFDGYHGDTTIGRPISKPDVHVSASPNQMRRSICSAKGQAEPFPPPCQPRP